MATLTDLEQVGSQVAGDSIDPNEGTIGGLNDWVFSRTYKVNGAVLKDYLFQILSPPFHVMDSTVTNAYLVKQRATRIDEVNMHLVCVFAQIPSIWNEAKYQPITFPGVDPSSIYSAWDFPFRSSAFTRNSQSRYEHTYFLGPINSIPTSPIFEPVDSDGNRVAVITDWTTPSSDEYISIVAGRQEIIKESVVIPWRGDIWDRRTLYALAK